MIEKRNYELCHYCKESIKDQKNFFTYNFTSWYAQHTLKSGSTILFCSFDCKMDWVDENEEVLNYVAKNMEKGWP